MAATNSRVRLIVAAGVAYGLVTKRQLTRRVNIVGTELLHDFMARLGFENANSCAQTRWQDGEARISPPSFLSVRFTSALTWAASRGERL